MISSSSCGTHLFLCTAAVLKDKCKIDLCVMRITGSKSKDQRSLKKIVQTFMKDDGGEQFNLYEAHEISRIHTKLKKAIRLCIPLADHPCFSSHMVNYVSFLHVAATLPSKMLLKLLIPRIKLIQNRREAKIKQMRREIAKLLETGQEATTRIRVENIIREEKMMAAQEILELFYELIAVGLPIIEAQRAAVGSYGKEFVAAASELKPDSGVNRKDGPKQFGGGSKLPLWEEQDKGPRLTMLPLSRPEEPSDSESEYESLEFPEILNVLLRPTPGATPENAPEAVKPATYEHTSPDMPFDSENAGDEKLAFIRDEHPAISSTTVVEVQQSSPFVSSQYVTESEKRDSCSPPSACVVGPLSTEESGASRDLPRKISDMDLQDVLTAAQAAADSADRAAAAARSAASLAQLRISELTNKTGDQYPESPTENPFHSNQPLHTRENPQFDHQNSSASNYGDLTDFQMSDSSAFFSHEQNNHQAERLPSIENTQFDHQNSSVSCYGDLSELQRPETSSFERRSPDQDHQQMRLPSMEDDPYYSYPNLFTSQNPDCSLGSPSFSDKAESAHGS
ncbi:unnamed protein product [Brassica oleracea]